MRKGLVTAVAGKRKHIDVSMDWTDFDKDDQTTLALSLILKHGRAIPVVWTTAKKSTLKHKQTTFERTAVQKKRTHSLFRQGGEIVLGALPDWLERICLRAVRKSITVALNKGFCYALS